ncbi:Os04g0496600, partial [Oryza sativa Japonica Group]
FPSSSSAPQSGLALRRARGERERESSLARAKNRRGGGGGRGEGERRHGEEPGVQGDAAGAAGLLVRRPGRHRLPRRRHEWHAARLASLNKTHTVTWEEFKKKQKVHKSIALLGLLLLALISWFIFSSSPFVCANPRTMVVQDVLLLLLPCCSVGDTDCSFSVC